MKTYAFALATTAAIAYIACAIFDALFPPFGMLTAFAPHSPMPIYGTPLGFLLGFVMFTVVGFVFGAVYGLAWDFWSKKLN